MSPEPMRTIQRIHAQRLAISCQLLDQTPPAITKARLLSVIRQLGCLQYDPIRVVAPSHQIVLWSRLGAFSNDDLNELLWTDRSLFEYWAHAASIVVAENFPIHRHQMELFATGDSAWSKKSRRWLKENETARRQILRELKTGQPMGSSDFKTNVKALWQSNGWTQAQGVKHLLQLMWHKGEVAVAGREANRKLYATADSWYAPYQQFESLPLERAVDKAVQIALGALGLATRRQIENHFIKGYYPDLHKSLERLEQTGEVLPAILEGEDSKRKWYLTPRTAEMLDSIESGQWSGQTTLLSPFDNLTTDRERVDQLWNFNARSELYVPKEKRVYGHYVLPILWNDQLAGRVDPTFHTKERQLEVEAIYAEDWARSETVIGRDLGACLLRLAEFLGAREIKLSRRIPRAWNKSLRQAI